MRRSRTTTTKMRSVDVVVAAEQATTGSSGRINMLVVTLIFVIRTNTSTLACVQVGAVRVHLPKRKCRAAAAAEGRHRDANDNISPHLPVVATSQKS